MGQNRYEFDPYTFLSTIGEGRISLHVSAKQPIFGQGDPAGAVFYIQRGNVKVTVSSSIGREATIGMLGAGDFFGEGCLAGQPLRGGSARAITSCDLLRIDQQAMKRALYQEHKLSDLFVSYLLARNVRYQQDLVDHLFNSSEKRLARVLLLLAHFNNEGRRDFVIPTISQATLAEMVGTTRSRVNFFLSRFRKQGFIHCSHGLQIDSSLISVLLSA